MNNVEVNRGLLSNRKKDAEIRITDLHAKMQSLKNNYELKFDDLSERINTCKGQFLEGFEVKAVKMLDEVQGLTEQFDDQIDYLEAVVDQVKQIQEVGFSYLDRKP